MELQELQLTVSLQWVHQHLDIEQGWTIAACVGPLGQVTLNFRRQTAQGTSLDAVSFGDRAPEVLCWQDRCKTVSIDELQAVVDGWQKKRHEQAAQAAKARQFGEFLMMGN